MPLKLSAKPFCHGTAWLDVSRPDVLVAQPFHDSRGSESGTLVRADEGRLAIDAHQPGQGQNDVLAAQRSAHFDGQAFACVLVQDAQHLERSTVGQLVMHDVVRPHAIGRRRAGNSDIAATAALSRAVFGQVQSWPAP